MKIDTQIIQNYNMENKRINDLEIYRRTNSIFYDRNIIKSNHLDSNNLITFQPKTSKHIISKSNQKIFFRSDRTLKTIPLSYLSDIIRLFNIHNFIFLWNGANFIEFISLFLSKNVYFDINPLLDKIITALIGYFSDKNTDCVLSSKKQHSSDLSISMHCVYAFLSSLIISIFFLSMINFKLRSLMMDTISLFLMYKHDLVSIIRLILFDLAFLLLKCSAIQAYPWYCKIKYEKLNYREKKVNMIEKYENRYNKNKEEKLQSNLNKKIHIKVFIKKPYALISSGISQGFIISVKWINVFIKKMIGMSFKIEIICNLSCDNLFFILKHFLLRFIFFMKIPKRNDSALPSNLFRITNVNSMKNDQQSFFLPNLFIKRKILLS